MKKFLTILLKALGGFALLFAVVFSVYFFNLDMKLLSKIEPLFLKHYDKMDRKTYI